ncbi:cytochrome c oxidase assembly protein [Cereibacter sp. SYSU M97828]|nr:cytochrome c oxidase assembly protein [Cereibacter flavus]
MDRMTTPYCGAPPMPADLASAWNTDPLLLAAMAVAAICTFRVGGSRVAWAAGVAVLAVSFLSPLCALASALFSARVLHHVLIVAVAAPLLVIGMRVRVGLSGPAFLAHMAAVWAWHLPAPYAAALSSDAVYWLMEATLLGTAVWLWSAMMVRPAQGVALALGTLLQMGMLGALLTFAGRVLHPFHALTTAPYGLDPLEDQQLAGLLMWAPAALPYLGFAIHGVLSGVLPRAGRA